MEIRRPETKPLLFTLFLFCAFVLSRLGCARLQQAKMPQYLPRRRHHPGGHQRTNHPPFSPAGLQRRGEYIRRVLKEQQAPAHFFHRRFYRLPANQALIWGLKVTTTSGAHSDKHLLYARPGDNRDLLVSKAQFTADLLAQLPGNYRFGIRKQDAPFFSPPLRMVQRHCNQPVDAGTGTATPSTSAWVPAPTPTTPPRIWADATAAARRS